MEQTSKESQGFCKLSWLQRIGFGSGDLAQNLIFQTTCMYLLFFYTDIYGLDAVDEQQVHTCCLKDEVLRQHVCTCCSSIPTSMDSMQ